MSVLQSRIHGGLLQALSKGFVVKSGMQKSVMSILSENVVFEDHFWNDDVLYLTCLGQSMDF